MDDRKAAQQEDHQVGAQQPHRGDDELGPDQFVDIGGQGVHQIALIRQQISVKALDHDHHGHDLRHDDGDEGQKDDQDEQDLKEGAQLRVQKPDGQVRQQHQGRQHRQHGQHGAPGGPEFMLQQFS